MVLLGTYYFLFLGSHPLLAPDEARYGEISREMLLSKQFFMPTFNYILIFRQAFIVLLGTNAVHETMG